MITNIRFSYFFLLIVIICSAMYLTGCGNSTGTESRNNSTEGTFRSLALENREVYELRSYNGYLFAGTDRGLYRRKVSQNSWKSVGMTEASIRTFVVFSKQEILAPLNFGNGDSVTIGKTTDGGDSWIPFRNGFGGDLRVIPLTLAVHPDSPDILYARGFFNVAKSTNRGRSWESVFATWETLGSAKFVTIDPNKPDIVWAGGATAIFAINLLISADGGDNWKRLDKNVQKLENVFESTANDLIIKPGNSSEVLLGMSDGISRSKDMGESWESVFSSAKVQTLTRSKLNPQTIFASGNNSQGNLFFLITRDFGDTWQTIEMEDRPFGIQVNDVIAVENGDREILYFATNKGVYSFAFGE